MIALDANVLLYSVDSLAGERYATACRVLGTTFRRADVVLPAQVLGEFCHVAGRKFGYNGAELEAFLTSWIALANVEPYRASDVEAAIRTSGRHKLPFWDALIWAVCERVGVNVLVTEDFQDGRTLGRVTFLDPFNPANAPRLGLGDPA